jgi:hypothetical protein
MLVTAMLNMVMGGVQDREVRKGMQQHPLPMPVDSNLSMCTVRVFRQNFALEDAIGSHACSIEANMRVTNGIPLGESADLIVVIINHVETPKARG